MTYSVDDITKIIGAKRHGKHVASIRFLLTDSRSLCFPEDTLFFALRSMRNDGHRYLLELYCKGVRCFVVSTLPEDWEEAFPEADFLQVEQPLVALQTLARHHREAFKVPVVGITGSNGKTIVKEWLNQLLAAKHVITRSPRSYNSQTGVPLSLWLMNEKTQIGLFEAGISQPGEMLSLAEMIQPDIAVLTNLGAAHQENFASMEAKCREKLRLFAHAETMVYNADDPIIRRVVAQAGLQGEQICWSASNKEASLFVLSAQKDRLSTTVTYRWKGGETSQYTLPFIDDASVDNSIACAIVCFKLGMSAAEVAAGMGVLEPVAMRLEVKEGQNGCTIINDSYNSDINSLDIALAFMRRRSEQNGCRRTLILSDIEQSGEEPEHLYKEVSALCVKRDVDKFVGIGPQLSAASTTIAVPEKSFFNTVEQFLNSKTYHDLRNEVVLIKGARRFGFDRISDRLAKKVHETILEVNLGAVVKNLNYYRSFMKPDTKLTCMIKANAYGAGSIEIAKTLQDSRVDYLAVAVVDEGVTLRKNGITANVMIMNPEMSSFKALFDYDLEPEVYSFRLLDALIKAAEKEGIVNWPVHIKLDTGMCRLGFNPKEDMDRLIARLKSQDAVTPKSVFSHFVGSDSNDFDDFSTAQFALFDAASKKLQGAFSHRILRHMDNSAGIEHFPERQLDMCRLGLGLYGINPRNNAIINNVSTLKTTILQLRSVSAGTSVGYSRRTILQKDSVVATIPIGYADGLLRSLGNRRCHCMVNGHEADYIGNICMDVSMIDVTGIDCQEGDTVEIFGDHLPVTLLSDTAGTIPYEILTGVSERVKRVYFQD